MLHLKLKIDNVYDDGTVTNIINASMPYPPLPTESNAERDDWEYDYIFALTGTDQEEGDAGYFVEVLESSDPGIIPVGEKWEWC